MINPEEYTVSVRMESVDGERLYVARIQELPDVEEYADTPEFARELALDTIATMYEICQEKGLAFPSPNVAQAPEASGRVTLRLAKSIHAAAIQRAQVEGISLNQYMSNAISSALIKADSLDVTKNALTEIFDRYNDAFSHVSKIREIGSNALNYFSRWEFSGSETETIIETTLNEAPLLFGPIRYGSRFDALDFNDISPDVITRAVKVRLPVETHNKGRRQQFNFIKAGAV